MDATPPRLDAEPDVDDADVDADAGDDDAPDVEPVNANKLKADEMVAMIETADAATLEMLSAAEDARSKKSRTSVLTAIDVRLDELEG